MRLKLIRRDRGSFSGGLLPFLPVCCRDRAERVLAVRVMRRYGKSVKFNLLSLEQFC
ncbi:plasmid mobilization protein [Salmonella enterica subsp. enterica serovar Typhimurium]|nr:plasmid mobilization protein [Salmonella enterica subsp. enterica serovar Typhimurium]